MWKWYDTTVVRIEDMAPDTKRFWLKAPDGEKIDFKAGQFVTMDLPVSEKRLQRWRSYSIANAPDASNELEFCIVHLDGGVATQYLFEKVEVGSTIRFKGPDGAFFLKEPVEKDLVFVCTGTGVAPFRSMILDLIRQEKPHQKLHLIFGTRYESGILYRDEFEALARAHPEFRYDVVLSREASWTGYKGHVHQVYQELYPTPRPDVDFYLCGWSSMIDEAVARLMLELGYDKSQIHYELYG